MNPWANQTGFFAVFLSSELGTEVEGALRHPFFKDMITV